MIIAFTIHQKVCYWIIFTAAVGLKEYHWPMTNDYGYRKRTCVVIGFLCNLLDVNRLVLSKYSNTIEHNAWSRFPFLNEYQYINEINQNLFGMHILPKISNTALTMLFIMLFIVLWKFVGYILKIVRCEQITHVIVCIINIIFIVDSLNILSFNFHQWQYIWQRKIILF